MPATDRGGDQARFRRLCDDLAEGIEAALPGWVSAQVTRIADAWFGGEVPTGLAEQAAVAGREAAAEVGPRVRELLARLAEDQPVNPLALVRSAVCYPTSVLRAAGVPEVQRDDFAERSFPDDVYDLSPATFADLDPNLHELGLAWGAAKAYMVLSGRRPPGAVLAFIPDLMDRSKVSAAAQRTGVQVRFLTGASELAEQPGRGTMALLVDLSRPGVVEALAQRPGRSLPVVGFGSHVDREGLEAGRVAGCDQVMARSRFFAQLDQLLALLTEPAG